MNTVEIFVSSDSDSIPIGHRWLDIITDGLRECVAMFVFCSPQSIGRPWINFEAGAGWLKGIEVVPICHSGMTPSNLPIPIKLLQGMQATDRKKLQDIFALVASKLGSSIPKVDIDALAKDVEVVERRYVFEYGIGGALAYVGTKNQRILEAILKATAGELAEVAMSMHAFDAAKAALEAVEKLDGDVEFEFVETQIMLSDGPRGRITRNGKIEFTPSARLIKAAEEVLAIK